MAELTSKEWRVYNLLKSSPEHWWTCKEIKEQVPSVVVIDDERNPSPELTQMRIKLNESPVLDKIVITKNHCFKIANEVEYWEARTAHINRIKSQVAQVQAMDLKYHRNGQGKLFNNVLNELTKANEQFHETFIDEAIEKAPIIREPKQTTFVFVDLVHKKGYIVENVLGYELNTEINIAYVDIAETGQAEFADINEVITMEQFARSFYENYERLEFRC